jgi:hypothetical protein
MIYSQAIQKRKYALYFGREAFMQIMNIHNRSVGGSDDLQ